MLKKKISLIIVATMLSSFSSQTITTLANEIQKEKISVADISKL